LQKGTSNSQSSSTSSSNLNTRRPTEPVTSSGATVSRHVVTDTGLGSSSTKQLNNGQHHLGRALVRTDTGISPRFVGFQSTPAGLLLIGKGGARGFRVHEALAGGDGGDYGIAHAGVAGDHGRVGSRLCRDNGEEGHGGGGEDSGEMHFGYVFCVLLWRKEGVVV
ncbi:hypothetical protein K457DRAFT_1891866, partial [Linnemannia elongata AG-77]